MVTVMIYIVSIVQDGNSSLIIINQFSRATIIIIEGRTPCDGRANRADLRSRLAGWVSLRVWGGFGDPWATPSQPSNPPARSPVLQPPDVWIMCRLEKRLNATWASHRYNTSTYDSAYRVPRQKKNLLSIV